MPEGNQKRYKFVIVQSDNADWNADNDCAIPTFAIKSVSRKSPDDVTEVEMIDGTKYTTILSPEEFQAEIDKAHSVIDEDSVLDCMSAIGSAEMHHMETDEDEDMDGEWEYTDYEVSDGTIRDNFPVSYYRSWMAVKALEIIRDKEVDMTVFNDSPTLEYYNEHWYAQHTLTQEEFDLLKEALS